MNRTITLSTPMTYIPTALLTLGAAVLLPLAFHLLPVTESGPLGARLLPIFYAPMFAILLGLPRIAILAAALAPVINHLLTGRPAAEIVGVLTLELVIFGLVLALIVSRWPRLWVAGPLAFLAAKAAVFVFMLIVPALAPAPAAAFTLNSTTTALPGIVALLVINAAWVYFSGRTARGER
jgi:hypothetical protein